MPSGSAVIKGQTYSPVDAAFPGGTPAAGIYWALPDLGVEPDYSGPIWNDTKVRFIGEAAAIGRKRLHYEVRYAWIDLVIVGTPAGATATKRALLADLTQLNRYTIVLPQDAALNGCTLAPITTRTQRKTLGNGTIAYLLPLTFEILSDEN